MRNLKKCRPLFHMIYNRSIHYLPLMKGFYDIKLINTDKHFPVQNNISLKSNNVFNGQCKQFSVCNVWYGKAKKLTKEQVSKMKLDLREVDEFLDSEKIIEEMKKAVEHMKNDFVKHLTVRTNIGSIEELIVEFEGKKYQLQELVQVARKPNFVILNAIAFPQAMPDILESLDKSGMNLSPQQDGTKISIPIPKVTKEHREELAKGAKAMFTKCRINIKAIGNKHLQTIADDKQATKEIFTRIKHNVEMLAEKHIQEAENMLNTKQTELLGS